MTTAPPITPLEFELGYRKLGMEYNRHAPKFESDEFLSDPERAAKLPIVPVGFEPLRGDWPTVTAAADRLNTAQLRSGHIDYFFFPEVVEPFNPLHCDMCKRAAAKEAAADE